MKVPLVGVCEPDIWFALKSIENPEISELIGIAASRLVDSSVLFLSAQHAARCRQLETLEPTVGLVFKMIGDAAVIVDGENPISAGLVELKKRRSGIGAIPSTLASPDFALVHEQITKPVSEMETPDSAFSRIFSRHLALASTLTIIDPYAGKNLLDSNSALMRILAQSILPNKDLLVEIHTKVHVGFDDPTRVDFENASSQLAKVLDQYRPHWPTRNAGMSVRLYRSSAKVSGLTSPTAQRDKRIKFAHDRHFEFGFRDKFGCLSGTDQFSLGNGLDVFSFDDEGLMGMSGSQTYASDAARVWAWSAGDRQKALDAGSIKVQGQQFGTTIGEVVFDRPRARF